MGFVGAHVEEGDAARGEGFAVALPEPGGQVRQVIEIVADRQRGLAFPNQGLCKVTEEVVHGVILPKKRGVK
jgi:hypothetical protein